MGEATKIELKVPTMMPKVITHANGRMTGPPSRRSANVAPTAVPPVNAVRGSVSFTDRLSVSWSDCFRFLCRFSRTRSKMMIVSLSE